MSGQAWRNVAELDCHGVTVQLDEDGDVQDDGTVLWSGCASGTCPVCDQNYVDWWDGTFAIGEPTGSHNDTPPEADSADHIDRNDHYDPNQLRGVGNPDPTRFGPES